MTSSKFVLRLMALVVIATLLLSGCAAPTAAPTAAVEEPTKAAEPTEAPAVEEATEAPVAEEPVVTEKGAIPYPDAKDLGIGGLQVNRQPISEIVTYKALPEYHQPAWMDKFVADGTLPAVADRLPKTPQVVLTSGMKDGIGTYGDVWHGFSACPTAGYNRLAGVSAGWFGIESYTINYASLVRTGPLFRADQDIEPFPQMAMSWEWSDDGYSLTMHLLEGAKWSDGVEFTSDDVMFTWEGYISDTSVNAPRHLDAWSWDGKETTLEALDKYTIKFTFPVVKPMTAFYLMNEDTFIVMPAHVLKSLHPKWSETTTDYKAFENALAPDNLPLVTMGPWVITEYKTDELMIMRRNPYFWRVDENGNQLPYMDEIQYVKGPSGSGRDLCTMAGNCDHMNLENPSTFVEVLKRAQEDDAKFQVTWGPETLGYEVQMNQSIDFGVKTDGEKAVRELLRDLRFRKALSYATDRDGIAQAIMRGDFLRAWAGGLLPGAPEFDKESVSYYAYDEASAKALLADLGLKDTNNDGFVEWTEGPMAGETLVLSMYAGEDQRESVNTAEALVNQWAAVGIKVNFRAITSSAWTDVSTQGSWELYVNRVGQAYALPFTRVTDLAPMTATAPNWHREGDTPREMQPFEEELVKIMTEYRDTYDTAKRKELMFQYNKIFTENIYSMGVFVGRYGLGLAKRTMNVPGGTPAFMYTWVEDAIMLDTLWAPADQQTTQNRPETLPVYK